MPTTFPRVLYRLAGTSPPADPRPALKALETALVPPEPRRGGRIRTFRESLPPRRPL